MVSGSFAFRISGYVYNLIRNHYLFPTLFSIFKEGGGEEEREIQAIFGPCALLLPSWLTLFYVLLMLI